MRSYCLLNEELKGLGRAGAFSGTFYIGCEGCSYRIDYKTTASGVILYTVTPEENYAGEYYELYAPKFKEKEQASYSWARMGDIVCLSPM